jgi:tetratricopeptide (TPR) repeat protein
LDHGSGASDRARESALASRLALQAEGERLAEQTLAKELWAASLAGGELRRRMDNDFGFGERLIQEGNHAQAILEFEKAKQAYQELWKLFRTAQPGFERYDEARSNFRSFAPAERARCGRLEERLNAAEQALRRGFAEALCETLQGRPDAGRAAPILQKAREGLSSLREEVLKAKQALEEGRAADEAWKAVEALTERVKQHQVGELKGLAEQGGEALQRGHRALAQGSADEARECYGNVLRAARQLQTQALKLAEEQYGKAYEAFVRRQFDAAGQGFEMVLKIEPAHVETTKRMFELARLQGKEGRKYEALQTLRILRQYQPRNPNIAQAILDLNQ